MATVTLTRPEKHNALDIPMFHAILAAAKQAAAEPGTRAVVLHGGLLRLGRRQASKTSA
jgi:enoyl-CoA hydratase/carnithine racemase